MVTVIALALSGSTNQDSGAVLKKPTAARTAPEKCRSARLALVYYRARTWHYQDRRGASYSDRTPLAKSCHWTRHALTVHRARARSSREAYETWSYHWEWERWLPDKWARIGACETGYGKPPGRWDWNSGTYQGAFGFYTGTWDAYKPSGAPSEAYLATPRQQYQAALNVAAVHGYGAWGCGGA